MTVIFRLYSRPTPAPHTTFIILQQPYLYDQTVQTFDYVKLGYFYNQGIR